MIKKRGLSVNVVSANISTTSFDKAEKNPTFFLRNRGEIIGYQLLFEGDDEVVLQRFVQKNILRNPLHSKFCEILYEKIISHVQWSMSSNIFWNEKEGKKKLIFCLNCASLYRPK